MPIPFAPLSEARLFGCHHGNKTVLHLIVREVEQERTPAEVVVLNSQVAALVNHGQGFLHICLVIDKLFGTVVASGQVVQVFLRMV